MKRKLNTGGGGGGWGRVGIRAVSYYSRGILEIGHVLHNFLESQRFSFHW